MVGCGSFQGTNGCDAKMDVRSPVFLVHVSYMGYRYFTCINSNVYYAEVFSHSLRVTLAFLTWRWRICWRLRKLTLDLIKRCLRGNKRCEDARYPYVWVDSGHQSEFTKARDAFLIKFTEKTGLYLTKSRLMDTGVSALRLGWRETIVRRCGCS